MQGMDLLSQIPKESRFAAPEGFWKSAFFDLLTVLLAGATGYFANAYLFRNASLYLALISGGLFLAVNILGGLLEKNFSRRALLTAIQGIALLAPFYGAGLKTLGFCYAFFAILVLWGEYLAKEELGNSVEIRFFHVVRRPESKTISAFSLLIVIFSLPLWRTENVFFSRQAFDSIFVPSVSVAEGIYPEYKFDGTIAAFAEGAAKMELQKNSSYALLPKSLKDQTLFQAENQIIASLSKVFGRELDPQDTFANLIFSSLNRAMVGLRQKFGDAFVYVWALAMFFFIRGFGAILGYMSALVSFIIYHLMISFRLIRIRTENKPHEIVEFT